MSLVHESMIACINRRFVSCHFNAFPNGPGADADAKAFIDKHKLALRYGGVVTTEGELIVAFDFERGEVFRSFQKALERTQNTPEEEAILTKGGLPAARLASELLDFETARRFAKSAHDAATTTEQKARALYLLGHLTLLDINHPNADAARKAFDAIESAPDDLADDIALDRIALQVELTPGTGFFTGWRLEPKIDAKAVATQLEKWIERAPQSNRIGQMHFFLGLARHAMKDSKGANAIWSKHFTQWPDDRWAMTSRIHHSSYVFSPYKNTHGRLVLDPRGSDGKVDPKLQEKLKKLAEQGGGTVTDPEVLKEILRQLREQKGG